MNWEMIKKHLLWWFDAWIYKIFIQRFSFDHNVLWEKEDKNTVMLIHNKFDEGLLSEDYFFP